MGVYRGYSGRAYRLMIRLFEAYRRVYEGYMSRCKISLINGPAKIQGYVHVGGGPWFFIVLPDLPVVHPPSRVGSTMQRSTQYATVAACGEVVVS